MMTGDDNKTLQIGKLFEDDVYREPLILQLKALF